MKLATYNIHKGEGPFGGFTLQKMKELLLAVNADIICLQEVVGRNEAKERKIENWPNSIQSEFLAPPGFHHVYFPDAHYRKGHHGNAVISRYEFLFSESISVAFLKGASRAILHTKFCIDGKILHVLCVHFGLFEIERRSQIEKLCRRIHEHVPDEEPLLVVGDFNDWRAKVDSYLWKDLRLTDAHYELTGRLAKTVPSVFPILPVDRIYYRGVVPSKIEVLDDSVVTRVSDHLPIIMDFELN